MTKALKGIVVRIVHVSPTGGAIFRLLPQDAAKSVRIVASSKAIPLAPGIGEFLTVRGEYVNDRVHGYQFLAIASTRSVPVGRYIVNLLVSHPDFSWIGMRSAKRLWNSLGERLYSSLASCNVGEIADAAEISLSDGLRLIRGWRTYARDVAVAEFFVERGLPLSALAKTIELWGNEALARVSTNPYCLVAYTPWTEVDEVCTERLGYDSDDEVRLIGACQSCIDEYVHRNRSIGIPMSVLLKRLTTRLGTVALAKESTRVARSHGVFSISLSSGYELLQPVGTRILEQAFLARFTKSEGVSPSKSLGVDSQNSVAWSEHAAMSSPQSRVTFLPVDSYKSFSGPVQHHSNSVHVFPSESMRSHFASAEIKTLLYCDLIKGTHVLDDSWEFVIYGAEAMDIAIATTLFYALPWECRMTIVCPRNIYGSDESFWSFLLSLAGLRRESSLNGDEPKNDVLRCDESQAVARTNNEVIANARLARRITVSTKAQAKHQALAFYREATETTTALLITALKGDATSINDVLHSEHVDLRQAMKLPTPFLKIHKRKHATLGARVVARKNLSNKHIWAGATGVVSEIFTASNDSSTNFTIDGLTAAVIDFDTIGRVGLTSHECGEIDFAYAVPFSMDRWATVSHRIVIFDNKADIDIGHLSSSISRTVKSFLCIETTSARSSDS